VYPDRHFLLLIGHWTHQASLLQLSGLVAQDVHVLHQVGLLASAWSRLNFFRGTPD
jgi:hypothetical protein